MNKDSLKKCPFCGGNAKLSFRQSEFFGQNDFGNKKISYFVYVVCNRCHARGSLVKTDYFIDPNPLKNNDEFLPYIEEAVRSWNERIL